MRDIKGIEYKAKNEPKNHICFTHANGFHPDTYKTIISELTEHHQISAPLLMPFDENMKPDMLKSWYQFAEEIKCFNDNNKIVNPIGIGHSLGGVSSLMAQTKHPTLFKAMVLIDPVFLPEFLLSTLGLILPTIAIRKKFVPVAKIARNRRDTWSSKAEAKTYLRKKKVFADITDDEFDNFIDTTIVQKNENEVKLRYSKEWEAQVYATISSPWKILKQINIPILIIRGKNSDVLQNKTWDKLKNNYKHVDFAEIPNSGHLVPFEKPKEVAKIILDYIS